jgi:pimeloyl-ACP methyl ester carboxylesterase
MVDVHAQPLRVHDDGAGLPVVLLHAFPLSSAMWLDQREALSGAYRVIAPDLRGFGGSPLGTDEPSLDRMADDVAAVLDSRALDRVVLGGLSMGGYVAMSFLRRHADRLLALVLAGTKAGPDPDAARANRERIAATVLAEGSPRVLVDDVLPGLVGDTTKARRSDVLMRLRALVQAAPPPAAAWAQRAMAAREESFSALATARVPALVIVGEEDGLSPPSEAEAMVAALPDARLVRLERAGHLCAMERPQAFTAALDAFLAPLAD